METLWQDLKYGARLLRLNPSFTIVAILSLALGIGANAAIFQLLNAVRLRTLPVKDPQQLAIVRIQDRSWASGRIHGRYSQITNAQWEQIRDRQEGFSSIFAWAENDFNLATNGEARYAHGMFVSGEFFNVLEVQPIIGRLLTADDDRRGCGPQAAVISYAFWQHEFSGDPSIIGRKIMLDGNPFPVVGVTPPGFYGVEIGRMFDLAVPICSEPLVRGEDALLNLRHGYWLAAMGRLKPGWTMERATAQLKAVSPAILEATVPEIYKSDNAKKYMEYRFAAFPASNGFSMLRQEYENPLWVLFAIAALVLLIACANLANLMLARASSRGREVAVRLAMGASRSRLLRQMFVESLLLAGIGATLGAWLATLLSQFMVAFISTRDNPLFMNLQPDWRVFGLTPALRATSVAPANVLKTASRGMTGGRERFGLRRVLVVSQVALSLVLLVGSLLFVRSLRNLLTLDPGFRQDNTIVASLDLSRDNIPIPQRQEFKRDLLERVRAVPGVDAAADASVVPVSGYGWNENIWIAGDEKRQGLSRFDRVSPGYFATMKTEHLDGRDFDNRDTATSPRVAIVNETFARKLLNGENPIGKTFRIDAWVGAPSPMYQIVGFVKDAKYEDLREEPRAIVYVAQMQDDRPDNGPQFVIHSSMPPASVVPGIKEAIMQSAPDAIIDFGMLQTQIRDSLLRERLMATLSGFFGVLAVVLATIGLYGVISYTVARRTNEIGLRVALGAQRSDVVGMIMREAGTMLVIGLAVGTVLTLAVARAAESMLYGLKPHDPLTLTLAIVALTLVAAVASFLPAHRAARLDPMAALREE